MRGIIEGCIVVGKSMAFDCLNFQSNVTEIVPAQKLGIFYLSTFIVIVFFVFTELNAFVVLCLWMRLKPQLHIKGKKTNHC